MFGLPHSQAIAQNNPTVLNNRADAIYRPNETETFVRTISNQIEIIIGKIFIAKIRIDLDKTIEWDGNGKYMPGDYISFFFDVTQNSSIANAVHIPQQVRSLNLGRSGQSTITATDQGNQLVILYDLNNNGRIDFNDANGNGRWDPFGTSAPGVPVRPETGAEVWIYNESIGDYFNPNAPTADRRWTNILVPSGVPFQVVVTGQVPLGTAASSPVGVILGNTDRDQVSEEDEDPTNDPLRNQTYNPSAPGGISQDVYTINRPPRNDDDDEIDDDNDRTFINLIDREGEYEGRVEADNGDNVFGLIQIEETLIDPFGRITDCDGQPFDDYTGFNIALYDTNANDPTYGLQGLTDLTTTELPDIANNGIPKGIEPNETNTNPFYLTNGEGGKYSFQLDGRRDQLGVGKTYILVVNPPSGSNYVQRRIRIEILSRNGSVLEYEAKAIDGKPLGNLSNMTQSDPFTAVGTLVVANAESIGLDIFAVALSSVDVCELRAIKITKTGDRIAAEPGDTVLYRINVKNLSDSPVDNIVIDDVLPQGLVLVEGVAKAEFKGEPLAVTERSNGRTVQFTMPPDFALAKDESFNLVYAAQVTPDSIRGEGENLAFVEGEKVSSDAVVSDGPAIHKLKIEPGIVEDCGTIIGRVFVDKNFDGHQQTGEPGVPNAVIFLEDGNRIMTDEDGLYTVANVLPGYHTGTLDLESVDGYGLAPNRYFLAENGQSRLVQLEPGGMVRMNFAVTPIVDIDGGAN